MASVIIDSGELPSAKGKTGPELEQVLRKWQSIADGKFESDCRALLQMINEVDSLRMWEYAREGFYKTRDEFLEKVVLIDFDLTEKSLQDIVGRLRQGQTETLRKRVVANAQVLRQHGGARSKLIKNDISLKWGTSAQYRANRLKRDHPDIFARFEAGEFRSVAEACRAAEGVTPGLYKLRTRWKKATPEERETFRKEIQP